MRLTKWLRNDITRAVLNDTFKDRITAMVKEKTTLFHEIVASLHGPANMKKIEAAPKYWFREIDYVMLNIDGWTIQFHIPSGSGFWGPTRYPQEDNNAIKNNYIVIKDKTLHATVKDFVKREEGLRKDETFLRKRLESVLRGCSTTDQVVVAMPNIESIVAGIVAHEKSKIVPKNPLVVSGSQVMDLIEAAKAGSPVRTGEVE
jgi:hypothetical protein